MAFNAKNKVAIIGVGHSKLSRGGERPVGALAVDASLKAIEDAGLTVADIDGLATFPQTTGPGVGPVPGLSAAPLDWMVEGLGVQQLNWWTNGGGNISGAIGNAINAIATGMAENVLVWRAMYQFVRPFGSGSRRSDPAARAAFVPRAEAQNAYTAPYGWGDSPSNFAPSYMRYMKTTGATRADMAAYTVTMRANANKNPNAIFYEQPMSFEDYMNCRMIAEPLCLFDCDMPINGAGAIVLTSADRVADMKQKPAYVTAMGSAGYDWRNIPPEEWRNDSAKNIARTLWSSTDMGPKDMDGAMFYDGFSPDIYWWVEGIGFAPWNEGYRWVQDGRIALGGELPINTFGGQVSEGRLHGIGHWIEGVKQIQGRADNEPGDGARQIQGAENILVATGMLGHGHGVILSTDKR